VVAAHAADEELSGIVHSPDDHRQAVASRKIGRSLTYGMQALVIETRQAQHQHRRMIAADGAVEAHEENPNLLRVVTARLQIPGGEAPGYEAGPINDGVAGVSRSRNKRENAAGMRRRGLGGHGGGDPPEPLTGNAAFRMVQTSPP
jgi:hypothetical protein